MSAKPAPKKNNKAAGRERGTANLKRVGKRTTPGERLSLLELDGFCLAYFVEKSVERACAARKIGVQRGWKYAKDPRFQERLQLIGQKLMDKATDKVAQDIADEFTLKVSKVDEQMFGILASPPHPYRGDADKVTAGLTIYKRLKLIDAVKVVQNNANAAAATLANGIQNSFQVYESAWLTRKKADWDRQLEEKHSNVLNANPQPPSA